MIAPPPIAPSEPYAELFAAGEEKFLALAGRYAFQAALLGCDFFDAAAVAWHDVKDGFHLDCEAHPALGRALALEVMSLLDEETWTPAVGR